MERRHMALDWTLASLHHLAVFALAAILAYELALTLGEVESRTILRLARVDAWFGAVAALALSAGLARVFLGAKGPEYYAANWLFWMKMGLFAGVGLISVLPTLRYLVWRREVRRNDAFRPRRQEIAGVRQALWAETFLFALIPIAAAGMARGFGL
jgi:putative membrane protein